MVLESGFRPAQKLLSCDRFPHRLTDDNRMEMVNRDGFTYFVPTIDRESNNKITGVCKCGNKHSEYMQPFTVKRTH